MALLFQPALVQAQQTADELQKETEAACAASATTKPTAEMIVAKVNKACELLSKEGKAAFPKFKGKDSEFIFAGTYVWIHDFHPTMLMHPIKYKLDGKSVAGMKDSNGKFLFVEMNKIAKEKGAGWVDYVWPKPGEEKASQKVSYVKMCKTPDGEELVVGIGVYDLPAAEVEKLLKN
jgi:methyl-accepting chemotaxis protein